MRRLRWLFLPILALCIILLTQQDTSAQTTLPPTLGPGWHNATTELEPLTPRELRAQLNTLQRGSISPPRAVPSVADDYIIALARGLENDPALIFEFVNNHVQYEPIFGWRNDAPSTLFSLRGSDADQATLFVELMRQAGFTANYRIGIVTYDVPTLANWIGSDATNFAVDSALLNGGMSITPNGANFDVIRIWAEADIGGTVFQFDPAMKTYAESAGLDINAVTTYDEATFRTNALVGATLGVDSLINMNEANVQNAMETHATELVNHIETTMPTANVADVIYQRDIVFNELAGFSTDLPNALNVTGAATIPNLPDTVRHTVQFQYEGIDETLFVDEFSSGTLSLRYDGATRPILTLNGTPLATGNPLVLGSTTQMDIFIDHPYTALGGTFADQAGPFFLQVGDSHTFLHDFGGASLDMTDFHVERLFAATGDGIEDETLGLFGQFWAHQAHLLRNLIIRQSDHIPLPHHVLGIVTNQNVINGGGHGIDIPFFLVNMTGEDGGFADFAQPFRTMTLMNSALEHGVLEQMNDSVEAISTIGFLTHANDIGETVFLADASNWTVGSNIRSQLVGYNASSLALLDSFIAGGRFLVVPRDGSLLVGQFTGFGVIGASDTAISMLISGGLNGGFNVNPGLANGLQLQQVIKQVQVDQKRQQSYISITTNDEPVEMAQGRYIFSNSDLRIGERPHFGLDLRRNYNSGRNHELSTVSQLGNGWGHTLDITIEEFSNPGIALGERRAIEVAQAAVAAHVMLDFMDVATGSPDALPDWMTATLVANWLMDQLTNNAAILQVGGQTMTFHRMADGNYSSPPTIAHELVGASGGFQLQFTDGSSMDFDGSDRIATWQDANGNATTFTYTGSNLTQVSTGTGYDMTFAYTGDLLTSVTDMSGRSVSYGYDANGNLTSFTDAGGGVWGYGYDGENRLTTLFRPLDNVTPMMTNTYDEIGQVIQQVDSLGNVYDLFIAPFRTGEQNFDGSRRINHYDHRGLWIAQEDTVGNRVEMTYDGLYRLVSVTGRDGGTSNFTYDLNTAELATQTNALGHTQTHTYSQRVVRGGLPAFDLTNIAFPDGTNASAVYDATGNLTELTDQAGEVWTFTYNGQGLPLTLTNPSGGVMTFTYNADGTLASRTDSDIGVTTYAYDTLKRLVTITNPDATTATLTYDALDRVTSVTDERGNSLAITYDADGRLTQLTDPAGNTTLFAHNSIGQVTSHTNRTGDTTTYQYDALRRVTQVTDPAGVSTTFTYDTLGRATNVTIAGFGATLTYSDEGFLTNINTPLGNDFGFTPNLLGFITDVTDPLGRTVSVTYDELNRIGAFTDGLGRTTDYTHEARGLLNSATFPVIGTATVAYGDLPFPTDITDFNGDLWQYGYTDMGRRNSKTDPLGQTITYTYDNLGRNDGATFGDGSTVIYTYDDTGNLTRSLFSDGTDLQTTYDNRNLPTTTNGLGFSYDAEERVTNTLNAPPALTARNFGVTYDPAGRIATLNYDGLFNVTYTYNVINGLVESVTDSLTGATISFIYDAELRITAINRSNGVNSTLTYDGAGQLTRLQDGTLLDLEYTYDDAGQITILDMDAPLTPDSVLAADIGPHGFTYDDASQVNSVGFAYDGRGRLTADADHAYTWDDDSRLTALDATTFTYTGYDDVQTRTAGGSTTAFHYNYALNDMPIVAEEVDGTVARYYVYSPSGVLLYLIDATDGNATNFYHFDVIGSTLALTDGAGAVDTAYAYGPFGKLLGQTGASDQPFKFVGVRGVRHEMGNIYQMRARYYDAETQRFISREPVWPDLFNAQRLNPYQYAENEPNLTIDHTGLTPEGGANGFGSATVEDTLSRSALVLLLVGVGIPAGIWGYRAVVSIRARRQAQGMLGVVGLVAVVLLSANMAFARPVVTINYSYDDAGRLGVADYGTDSSTFSYDNNGNLLLRLTTAVPTAVGLESITINSEQLGKVGLWLGLVGLGFISIFLLNRSRQKDYADEPESKLGQSLKSRFRFMPNVLLAVGLLGLSALACTVVPYDQLSDKAKDIYNDDFFWFALIDGDPDAYDDFIYYFIIGEKKGVLPSEDTETASTYFSGTNFAGANGDEQRSFQSFFGSGDVVNTDNLVSGTQGNTQSGSNPQINGTSSAVNQISMPNKQPRPGHTPTNTDNKTTIQVGDHTYNVSKDRPNWEQIAKLLNIPAGTTWAEYMTSFQPINSEN